MQFVQRLDAHGFQSWSLEAEGCCKCVVVFGLSFFVCGSNSHVMNEQIMYAHQPQEAQHVIRNQIFFQN